MSQEQLTQALQGLLDKYTMLVNSGDAGNWDPEEEPEVIAARAVLSATQPARDDGWLQDRGLLYRLTDDRRPHNRDEIRVMMADGSRSDESCSRRAGELLDRIRATQPAQAQADVSRPEYVRCIQHTHEDKKHTTWCGKPSSQFDRNFQDIDHAANTVMTGGLLVPCPECAEAITKTLKGDMK